MRRLLLPLTLALAACTVGPDYSRPDVTVPARFSEAQGETPAPSDAELGHWWTAFHDPVLDRLIADALAQNIDIRIAASRVETARMQAIAARAGGLPEIDATAGVNHIRFSKNAGLSSLAKLFGGGAGGGGNGGGTGGAGFAPPGDSVTVYSAGFDASWELDLFGGNRRRVEAARAALGAAIWSARDARLTLIAEVADDYLKLRALERRGQVLREEIEGEAGILRIVDHQADAGLVPRSDALQQGGRLETTRAALAALAAEEQIQRHAIALLLAKPPGELAQRLYTATLPDDPPPAVPPGLPSDLLRRRPDIRAAERRLAASTARIGVATADLYPHFSLTGVAEFISTALSNLFTGDSLQLMSNAAARFPVLDFGRNGALVGAARAEADAAYLDYRKAVLTAFRDVDDALVRYRSERTRNAALRRAENDAARAASAAAAQYRAGLVDYSAVYQAQLARLQARDALVGSDAQLREAVVSLYKALGGGWE